MRVGSLFTGIGGFDLGLERAGMHVVWQCETDWFCRRVLERHWPDVPCYPDVRELDAAALEPVDVLCGGFPCQDISLAGKGAGITGARSGLWAEFARLIRQLRPEYVLVENVPALRQRGLDVVLADLAASGYDAEWDGLPASAFGAPHRRDRLWLVAYPDRDAPDDESCIYCGARVTDGYDEHDACVERSLNEAMADPKVEPVGPRLRQDEPTAVGRRRPGDSGRASRETDQRFGWPAEPDVGRVAYGIPDRVDRLRALGNAIVPVIAEWLGQRIISYEQQRVTDDPSLA